MTFKFTKFLILFFSLLSQVQATAQSQKLSVTINRKAGQSNPVTSPVIFTAVFSAPINVATFTVGTIVLSGTATDKKVTAIKQVSANGTIFEITVNGVNNGTVIASIPAADHSPTSAKFGNTDFKPTSITIDNDRNLYTANAGQFNFQTGQYGPGSISRITADGVSSIVFGTTGSYPNSIACDVAGNLYTTNLNENTVSKITTDGGVSAVASAPTGKSPGNLSIDASGNIYTTSFNTISKITPEGESILDFAKTGSYPRALVFDASGNLYTCNFRDGTISKITADGKTTTQFATVGKNPFTMVIDEIGNLYVAYENDGSISKVTPAGITTRVFAKLAININCMAIDGSGNLYTGNNDNSVCKVTPSGVVSILGDTGDMPVGIVLDELGNVYTSNLDQTVTKITVSHGIALADYYTRSNGASTSLDKGYILPDNLVYFTAVSNNCTATLNWQTSAEIHSSYYGIETSTDAKSFGEVIKLASKNSVTGATYASTIKSTGGINYYRLKMVDAEGNYTFSETISVTVNGNCGNSLQVKVSPNPARDFINVEGLANGSQLSLLNAAGILVSSIKATGNTQRINISKFAHGIYMLRVEAADGSIQTVKVVKQ